MTTPLPSAHEPLPADFLRKYGAVKGMKYRFKDRSRYCDDWTDWGNISLSFPLEIYPHFEWCAPIGTIAAATTPLPVRRCDCTVQQGSTQFSTPSGHHLSCSIHRPYRHILPHALAALPEKPEGLICCRSLEKLPSAKWGDFVYWPIVPDGETPNGFPFADFAYAIPAQSGQGQGQGKEYRVTCPHCLGQQKANGAVCLECNGIGYWMNPYPLSTQPEGGEECAHQIKAAPVASVKSDSTEAFTTKVAPCASNAAPANVPTVAGSGQEECMVPITGYPGISLGKCEVDLATGEVTPSPPSTAGETGRTLADRCFEEGKAADELFETINRILGGRPIKECTYPDYRWACTDTWTDDYDGSVEIIRGPDWPEITKEQAAEIFALGFSLIYESPFNADVNDHHGGKLWYHNLSSGPCHPRNRDDENMQLVKAQRTARDLERQLAAAEAWKDEISAAIQRSGLGIMRTSQGPIGTMICTRPEVKDAEDRKVLELINENIDLETRIAAVTAERDEARAEARDACNHMIFQVIKARKAFNSYGSQGHACDCRSACQSIIHSAGAVVPDYEAELTALRARLAAAEAEVRRMTDAFHERCRVHGETHRMATEMHALAESLHAKLAAVTAERDEVGKRLETIQTT